MPRPPYRLAVVAAIVVWVGYLISLAPSVTFWDAGEFIAASKTLGIPHPPGTPLFVMIAHLWGALLPFGEYAWRLNLLSATLSAAAAGCFFLVAHETLVSGATSGESHGNLLRIGGACAAVLIAGFSFTTWQNSNETEVYAVAIFTIAAICWLALRWRAQRGTVGAGRTLLLILYLAGLSIGNHLLALLAGPAVITFICMTLRAAPSPDQKTRAVEWAQLAVVAGTWALLIGSGLGNTQLTIAGVLCYIAAAVFALRVRASGFAAIALLVSLIGVTSYLFLFIRSAQHPLINEAQPDNWNALLAVIRRAQYPVRTPWDDPTVLHGPDNPGRTPTLLGLQLLNYIQYFDWQWANGITRTFGIGSFELPVRTFFTAMFLWLGVQGLRFQRRIDRGAWWLLFTLFLTTGLGLVLYMNFKPGYGMGYELYPNSSAHEVRDRDYFFVVSFTVWGLWAGMGLASLARAAARRVSRATPVAVIAVLALALLPFAANFAAASRRGPDARLPGDLAYDLLNSMPPYGILFTYGDNDTFPLWWAQEVAGIRQDVTVICLALAQTDWYMRQLRDNPVRPFEEQSAPPIWRGLHPVVPTWPVHSMTDAEVAAIQPTRLSAPITVPIGPIRKQFDKGTVIYSNDLLVLRVLQQNLDRRPIAWASTVGRDYQGLDKYLVQQGMVFRLESSPPAATTDTPLGQVFGTALDIPTTERLLWETYRYPDPLNGSGPLEPSSRGIGNAMGLSFVQLAFAYQARGDTAQALKNLERASELSANPAIRAAIAGATQARGGQRADGQMGGMGSDCL